LSFLFATKNTDIYAQKSIGFPPEIDGYRLSV